jgi:PEP-CTERM motif
MNSQDLERRLEMKYSILFLVVLMLSGLLAPSFFVGITNTIDEGSVYASRHYPGNGNNGNGNNGNGNNGNGNNGNGPNGNGPNGGGGGNNLSAVPEPASFLLMGAGLVGFGILRKKLKNRFHRNPH